MCRAEKDWWEHLDPIDGSPPGGLAGLSVAFKQLLAEADDAIRGRTAGTATRPRVRVKRILRDRLQRETFQRAEDVKRALGMAGRSRRWHEIADAMAGAWQGNGIELADELNAVVKRRNAIVHEGDYERKERPQRASLVRYAYYAALDDLNFMADLIDAIHRVVSLPELSKARPKAGKTEPSGA